MILLKSCPRCRGDLADEEWLDQVELACLQCGYRREIEPRQRYPIMKKARVQARRSASSRLAA